MDDLRARLAATTQDLQKAQHQQAVNRRQHISALRRADLQVAAVKAQLQEALRDGAINRADAMFSRLPFTTLIASDADTTEGSRAEALDRENGELRALLAAVHMRVCGEGQQGVYELPVAVTIDQMRADFEAAFTVGEQ